jgi:hypothetical protein
VSVLTLPKGVWDWLDRTRAVQQRQSVATVQIASELSKIRALKEYELGVLVGEDEGLHIVQASDLRPNRLPRHKGTDPGRGALIWHEDTGAVRASLPGQ